MSSKLITDSLIHAVSVQEEETLSAGGEGLPEEVLAAGLPLSGGEQRPAAGGPFQVNTDVFGFPFSQREVLLLQSLVLHLQEVREQQVGQRGAGHVLQVPAQRGDLQHRLTPLDQNSSGPVPD